MMLVPWLRKWISSTFYCSLEGTAIPVPVNLEIMTIKVTELSLFGSKWISLVPAPSLMNAPAPQVCDVPLARPGDVSV